MADFLGSAVDMIVSSCHLEMNHCKNSSRSQKQNGCGKEVGLPL